MSYLTIVLMIGQREVRWVVTCYNMLILLTGDHLVPNFETPAHCAATCPYAFRLKELDDAAKMAEGRARDARIARIQKSLSGITSDAIAHCEGPFEQRTRAQFTTPEGVVDDGDDGIWLTRICAAEVARFPVFYSSTYIDTVKED